ncbi:hypothetical protein Tco_0415845 [Tanacetum coccineum]
MTDKYCPRGRMKKLEVELWDLNVKGTDVIGYNQCFQELALMYVRMFPKESDKIKRYVSGLPDMIHGSVMASKPKTIQDAIEMATELMDKKISTLAERQAENKRKLDNNNHAQQQPPNKQGLAIAYTVGFGERKEYTGTLPLCNKCKFHHNGLCTVKETSLAMNVGIKGITGGITRNYRIKTMESKLKGKLSPRYVRPFQVLAKVGSISYKLELPQELSRVYNTFHVSNLKKCYAGEPLAIPLDGLHIEAKLHFVEEPVEIMDREVKWLKQSRIPIVKLVEIILFIVNSGCSKHMMGNLKLLSNFVEQFLGTVKFGNDQIAPILGYGDLVQGNITIKRVYYVEGLNHNLFSVGQFCDADLEVAVGNYAFLT